MNKLSFGFVALSLILFVGGSVISDPGLDQLRERFADTDFVDGSDGIGPFLVLISTGKNVQDDRYRGLPI